MNSCHRSGKVVLVLKIIQKVSSMYLMITRINARSVFKAFDLQIILKNNAK